MRYLTETTSGGAADVVAARPDAHARCANAWSSLMLVDMGTATIKSGIRVFTQHRGTRRREEPSP